MIERVQYRLWRRVRSLKRRHSPESLTFEELAACPAGRIGPCFEEFMRRLRSLVFWAAQDRRQRILAGVSADALRSEAEDETLGIFVRFVPFFRAGEPDLVLPRFAHHVRNELDAGAFERIRFRYYEQLPLYYLSDARQRSFLSAAHELRLAGADGKSLTETLAGRMHESIPQTKKIVSAANQSVKRILDYEHDKVEWRRRSEDTLP
jgi:hypothetical protein